MTVTAPTARPRAQVSIRPLRESDLDAADAVCRRAFATFIGVEISGDSGYVHTRWRSDPTAALAADVGGELVGSNFVANWGSVGFFGPLTVTPTLWDQGVASRLMEATLDVFERWGTTHAGLFTFSHSTKHVGLYQRFGFWPRSLTAIMSRSVESASRAPDGVTLYSQLAASEQETCLDTCAELTGSVHEGLDLRREITAVRKQALGETLLLWDGDSRLVGLAVCHVGAGSEAGGGACLVKFGAVRPGPEGSTLFERLVDACTSLAASRGAGRLVAGANAGRPEAYRALLGRGFRADMLGVAMHRPDEPGYHRPGAYVIDDWR